MKGEFSAMWRAVYAAAFAQLAIRAFDHCGTGLSSEDLDEAKRKWIHDAALNIARQFEGRRP